MLLMNINLHDSILIVSAKARNGPSSASQVSESYSEHMKSRSVSKSDPSPNVNGLSYALRVSKTSACYSSVRPAMTFDMFG